MAVRDFKFQPRWKEELVCSAAEGPFVIVMTMGVPTVYFPNHERWLDVAPPWARDRWDDVHAGLTCWCSDNDTSLVVDGISDLWTE